MSTESKEIVSVPIVIIGDGILGTMTAREIVKMKKDVVILGPPLPPAKVAGAPPMPEAETPIQAATLRNHGTFQSGLLQNEYNSRRLSGKTDPYFKSLAGTRRRLKTMVEEDDLASEGSNPIIHPANGLLFTDLESEEELEEYAQRVSSMFYGAAYQKPLKFSNLEKGLIGDFGNNSDQYDHGHFFALPDTTVDMDLLLKALKLKTLDQSEQNRSSRGGNCFFFPSAPEKVKISTHSMGLGYIVEYSSTLSFQTEVLIICAGFKCEQILHDINPAHIKQTPKGSACFFNILKFEEMFGQKTPFFYRMDIEKGRYLATSLHGTSTVTKPDHLLASNGHKSPPIKIEHDSEYDKLEHAQSKKIKSYSSAICKTLKKSLGRETDKNPCKQSKNSFCLHFSSPSGYYIPSITKIEEEEIYVAHPGLAIASEYVAQQVVKKAKRKIKQSRNLTTTERDRFLMKVKKHHKKIKDEFPISEISWNKRENKS